MRLLAAISVAIVLVAAEPALAQQFQREEEVRSARTIGWVCGSICGGFTLLASGYIVRGALREFQKGKKQGLTMEEVIDELPKKRQVMFKGEKVPDWKISARQKATNAALKFLSDTNNWFEKKYVSDVADEAFRRVKEAIEARSIKTVKRRVTPECLEELRSEIMKLRQEQERHIFGRIEVTDVDIVHVEAPIGKENHTFTALVSGKYKDFFEDDETGELIRGDKKTYAFQEFWSFRRGTPDKGEEDASPTERWLVELIRPSTDLESVLEAKNVLAKIDLEEFAKDADPEFLKEFNAR